MKTLIILLLSVACYSQVTISIPLNTIHYKKSEYFAPNEGGSRGLIVSWTKNHLTIGTGVFENSYGRNSKLLVGGYAFIYKDVSFSLVGGVADNYPNEVKEIPVLGSYFETKKLIKGSQLTPMLMLTSKIRVYKNFGIQVNISPLFVNSGVYLNI